MAKIPCAGPNCRNTVTGSHSGMVLAALQPGQTKAGYASAFCSLACFNAHWDRNKKSFRKDAISKSKSA